MQIDDLIQEEKQLAVSNIGSECFHLLMNSINCTTNYWGSIIAGEWSDNQMEENACTLYYYNHEKKHFIHEHV